MIIISKLLSLTKLCEHIDDAYNQNSNKGEDMMLIIIITLQQ